MARVHFAIVHPQTTWISPLKQFRGSISSLSFHTDTLPLCLIAVLWKKYASEVARAESALSFRCSQTCPTRQTPLKSFRWNDIVTDKVTDELPLACTVWNRESALSICPCLSSSHIKPLPGKTACSLCCLLPPTRKTTHKHTHTRL